MQKQIILGLIKDLLINAIRPLEDEDYQRRAWFREESPEVSTYLEVAVHLIGRCQTLFNRPFSQEYLGQENYNLIKKIYNLVLAHVDQTEERMDPDLLTEEELLNDPKWHEIQALAHEVNLKLTEFINNQGGKIED